MLRLICFPCFIATAFIPGRCGTQCRCGTRGLVWHAMAGVLHEGLCAVHACMIFVSCFQLIAEKTRNKQRIRNREKAKEERKLRSPEIIASKNKCDEKLDPGVCLPETIWFSFNKSEYLSWIYGIALLYVRAHVYLPACLSACLSLCLPVSLYEQLRHNNIQQLIHNNIEQLRHNNIQQLRHNNIGQLRHNNIEQLRHNNIEQLWHNI